jgi:hypothetical protein
MTAAKQSKIANLREHILTRSDLDEERVYVPGWDCTVLVRALTGTERAKFLKQSTSAQPGQPQNVSINWDRYWADLVIMSTRDPEDGTLIFAPTDRDALLGKSGKNLEVVAKKARTLSGLEDDALPKSEEQSEDD